MKTSITSTYRPLLRAVSAFLIALVALSAIPRNAEAQLYVTQVGFGLTGGVSAFDANTRQIPTSGFAPITGLNTPVGLAVSGNNLFVANRGDGTVGVYDANTGVPLNTQLVTGLKKPTGLAFTGNTLYVSDFSAGTVSAYTFSPNTNTVSSDFSFTTITSLTKPTGLAVAGNILFVASYGTGFGAGTVGAYDAGEGGAFNSGPLISGLNLPSGLVVGGTTLYVSNQGSGTIGSYKFDPLKVTVIASNAAFIKGLNAPTGLAMGKGNVLFVVSALGGTVSDYTINASTAAVLDANFITGLSGPTGLAVKNAK